MVPVGPRHCQYLDVTNLRLLSGLTLFQLRVGALVVGLVNRSIRIVVLLTENARFVVERFGEIDSAIFFG